MSDSTHFCIVTVHPKDGSTASLDYKMAKLDVWLKQLVVI
jgi:hypothetical protein